MVLCTDFQFELTRVLRLFDIYFASLSDYFVDHLLRDAVRVCSSICSAVFIELLEVKVEFAGVGTVFPSWMFARSH